MVGVNKYQREYFQSCTMVSFINLCLWYWFPCRNNFHNKLKTHNLQEVSFKTNRRILHGGRSVFIYCFYLRLAVVELQLLRLWAACVEQHFWVRGKEERPQVRQLLLLRQVLCAWALREEVQVEGLPKDREKKKINKLFDGDRQDD